MTTTLVTVWMFVVMASGSVVGPFSDKPDCEEIRAQYNMQMKVSRCWQAPVVAWGRLPK